MQRLPPIKVNYVLVFVLYFTFLTIDELCQKVHVILLQCTYHMALSTNMAVYSSELCTVRVIYACDVVLYDDMRCDVVNCDSFFFCCY